MTEDHPPTYPDRVSLGPEYAAGCRAGLVFLLTHPVNKFSQAPRTSELGKTGETKTDPETLSYIAQCPHCQDLFNTMQGNDGCRPESNSYWTL